MILYYKSINIEGRNGFKIDNNIGEIIEEQDGFQSIYY